MNKNSIIAVTGAAGLAGSAVVDYLKTNGYRNVVPITRQMVDLRDTDKTLAFFDRTGADCVVHMAAIVYGLLGNMKNQGKSLLENTMINTNVIHSAKLCDVQKFVAMGTNAIYPWPTPLPYSEANIFDGRPEAGEFGYGSAKRHMLSMLEAYKMSYANSFDYCYLVSGNLFGPRDTFDSENGHVLPSLISKFYHASRDPESIVPVWGDGLATRDFLYTPELARIVEIAILNDEATGAINIGAGDRRSIEYVCKRLSGISGVSYDRVHYDATKPKGRPDCWADLSKLHALGYRKTWEFGEALKATYAWYEASQAQSRLPVAAAT